MKNSYFLCKNSPKMHLSMVFVLVNCAPQKNSKIKATAPEKNKQRMKCKTLFKQPRPKKINAADHARSKDTDFVHYFTLKTKPK